MKPDWLKYQDWDFIRKDKPKCIACKHLGKTVKETKHKGKERCQVHECNVHEGCFNTKYSYACDDYIER